METIVFESGGVKLSGMLSDPGADTVVVLCHGVGGGKNSSTNLALTQLLNAKNIATFRFDFFGHGESGGDFAEITPTIGVQNCLDAVTLMKQRFANVGVEGSSYGGYAGYMVAAQTEVWCAVLKCPVAEWNAVMQHFSGSPEEWKAKGWTPYDNKRLNYTFYEDCQRCAVDDAVHNITAPTLIVHGGADPIVPVEQSKKAAGKIRNCTLAIIEGADHQFTEHFDEMIRKIVEFIVRSARS